MFKNFFNIIYKKRAIYIGPVIIFIAAFLLIALFSFNPKDPSFNRATNADVKNLSGPIGAYIIDPFIQIFGASNYIIFTVFFVWGVLYFLERIDKMILRALSLVFLTCSFCALGFIINSQLGLSIVDSGYLGKAIFNYCSNFAFFNNFKFGFILLFIFTVIPSFYFAIGISDKSWLLIVSHAISGIKYIIDGFVFAISSPKMLNNLFSKTKDLSIDPEVQAVADSIKIKADRVRAKNVEIDNRKKITQYSYPPLSLLRENKESKQLNNQQYLKTTIDDLKNVLEEFGVKGEIIGAHAGPVVSLFELEPAAGTKSSRVIGLADDISRSMKSTSARIAVIPGQNAIGVELPNKIRQTIYMRDLLASKQYNEGEFALPLALGKDIGGVPVIADLAKMPHLLVAGTTGSGKSVSINTMLLSILYSCSHEECKLILIDPKMLELSVYEGIPHLLTPVVTEPKKAVIALKWVVKEMEERYRLMSHLGVRNIEGYNKRINEAKKNKEEIFRNIQTGFDRETGSPINEKVLLPLENIPFIVVVVDEMADLMLVAGKDIEVSIQRLSQMARAAGIHIVMATQRPSVDVITGVIKANFPTRISFQVTSRIDSRTVLGEQGAEQLLGMGDMLFMSSGSKIVRLHGPYVSDEEVRDIVSFLKQQASPQYIDTITVDNEEEAMFANGANDEEGDLYSKALEIVLRDKKASTSYIQRCLRIGYNRAAIIIEKLERNGVISEANHVGKREVLKN
jgi:S-DNA-T family DNA segregation ATPase FtsK/SpoIIIE